MKYALPFVSILYFFLSCLFAGLVIGKEKDAPPLPKEKPEIAAGKPLQGPPEKGQTEIAENGKPEDQIELPRKKPDLSKATDASKETEKSEERVRGDKKKEIPQEKPKPSPVKASRLKACPALINGDVKGKHLPSLETPELCGAEAPLLIEEAGGVKLKPAAQLNCGMATATSNWLTDIKDQSKRVLGQELASISVSTSYNCRRRNNRPDGKFSEHATMNALDVDRFILESGDTVSVEKDWIKASTAEKTDKAHFLHQVQKSACEVFTTTIGPDGDDYHKNHFHMDLGCHGKTCTYKLCQ